ncbi:hypothetical protein I316_01908 [Kwoniella heveanensis BCC8398]|uniref:Uncharacterized protein n=1 Tax=Kwoniella heveanensis BCC8398 TaxID=1296120 RepID=A0A1B9H061_9TREE|nr:hypothetical protein I316_01908 [Kwoniella heveanensis BCC8398]
MPPPPVCPPRTPHRSPAQSREQPLCDPGVLSDPSEEQHDGGSPETEIWTPPTTHAELDWPHMSKPLDVEAQIALEVMRCRRRLGLLPLSPAAPTEGAAPSKTTEHSHHDATHTPKRVARTHKTSQQSPNKRPHRTHSRSRASISLPMSHTILNSVLAGPQDHANNASDNAISAQERRHSCHLTSLPSMSSVLQSEVTPSHRQRQRPALQGHETCSSTQSVLGLTLGNDAAAGLPDDVPSSEGSAPLGIEPRAFGVGLEPSPVIYQTRQWSDQSAGEGDLPDWTSTFVQAAKTETTLSNTGSIEGRSVSSCGTSCSTNVSAYSNIEEYHRRVLCDDRDQCAGLLGKLKTGAFGLKPIIRVFKRHGNGNQ